MRTRFQLLAAFLFLVAPFMGAQETAALFSDVRVSGSSSLQQAIHWPLSFSEDEAPDIDNYSATDIALQKRLNTEHATDFVLVWNPVPDSLEYGLVSNRNLEVEYRSIDNEDITPYTWKWVHLQIEEPDGGLVEVKLRRPNWWMQENNATKIGNLVPLSMPEFGIAGLGEVKAIWPNQIDTRLSQFNTEAEYTYRPITGWFSRSAAETYDYAFSNNDTLGATPEHPFYSLDRQDYFPISTFSVGERVRLANGEDAEYESSLKRVINTEQVYNIEVWREHVYFVGDGGVLVHNSCFNAVKGLFSQKGLTHAKVGFKKGGAKGKRVGDEIVFDDGTKIPISKTEFPDLTGITARLPDGTPLKVEINNLKGNKNRPFDYNESNKWLTQNGRLDNYPGGYYIEPSGSPVRLGNKNYTWHHHEDGKTMMLVEQKYHIAISHVGGASIIEKGINKLGDFSKLISGPEF